MVAAHARADGPGFHVAAVILTDGSGRVLTVRKRGTRAFLNPGGKIERGETSHEAAVRELQEELGLSVDPAALDFVGTFRTAAANEPGHWLVAEVWRLPEPVTAAEPRAEIDEVRWVDPYERDEAFAPLLVELLARLPFP